MPDETSAVSHRSKAEAAAYVAELTGDLAVIARQHGLNTLCYLLEMARMEAENSTRHMNGRP
jgi:hypothetical protein